MIFSKTIAGIFLGVSLCIAQSINISGFVQDTGGVGISGAVVKLEKANISTTSGVNGAFTLTGVIAAIKPNVKSRVMVDNAVTLQNGQISFNLSTNKVVSVSIHDVSGRQIFNSKRNYSLGAHAISLPMQAEGIYLFKVTIGNEGYTFKSSPFGSFSSEQGFVSSGGSALGKQAKTMVAIDDVIAATKVGLLNYRCVHFSSDTSGVVIRMVANAGDLTDIDGNVYQIVKIGNQVWTVENLRVTRYNDGSAIPLDTSTTSWANDTTPKYCFLDNTTNADLIKYYGALYNWYVVSPTNIKRIAPTGWHVPTDAEWDTLQNYLIANGYNWDESTTDNKIAKALAARTDWYKSSTNGSIGIDLSKNNSSGFTALPGGYRSIIGTFNYFTYENGHWWSASKYALSSAHGRYLKYNDVFLTKSSNSGQHGFSVRLLRD